MCEVRESPMGYLNEEAAQREHELSARVNESVRSLNERTSVGLSVRVRELVRWAVSAVFPQAPEVLHADRSDSVLLAAASSVQDAVRAPRPEAFAEAMGRSRAAVQRHLAAQTEATEASPVGAAPAIPAPQGVLPCSCPLCGASLQVSVGVSAANSGDVSHA